MPPSPAPRDCRPSHGARTPWPERRAAAGEVGQGGARTPGTPVQPAAAERDRPRRSSSSSRAGAVERRDVVEGGRGRRW